MKDNEYKIPSPPPNNNGLYGATELYEAYQELFISVHKFMSDVNKDSSFGNLSIGGTASIARAKAKNLVSKAKNLESMVKAVCVNRK